MYFKRLLVKPCKGKLLRLGYCLGIFSCLFVIGLGLLFLSSVVKSVRADATKPYSKRLEMQVISDLNGTVPKEFVKKIFSSPELKFMPELMIRRLTWKESKLPYPQFLQKDRIERAFNFLKEHYDLLSKIEKKFKVDKEVITAIFLVETNLGKNTGRYRIFNVFYSMALSGEAPGLLKPLAEKKGVSVEDEKVRAFIKKRGEWAYNELLYLIQIAYENKWNPFSIKGSIFGAFGYPQFVPRSYLIYGYDWDKDGVVDLYDVEDALASIANYLHQEGYRMNSSYQDKLKVIMKYNASKPYAETVLKIASILKKLERTKGFTSEKGVQNGNSTRGTRKANSGT